MARQKIREFDAKKLIFKELGCEFKGVLVEPTTNFDKLTKDNLWLLKERLVIKPDMLFGKRGKLGLVLLDADFSQVKEYLQKNMNLEITIEKVTGRLTHFLIEPYVEHEEEYYLSIASEREKELIYYSEEGGINIEEKWEKTIKIEIPPFTNLREVYFQKIPEEIAEFIKKIYSFYHIFNFCYLELNPFAIQNNEARILDAVAQVDDCSSTWRDFPSPKEFGQKTYPEEEFIRSLDKESGASLKLTILNPKGRIWNILSGGGASIIYLDTIADLGKPEEIANYGEYSGNPTAEETYQYAKTILSAMIKEHHPQGKALIIGGAIANFTDVEKTFIGIIKALIEYQEQGNYEGFAQVLQSRCLTYKHLFLI